MAAVQINATVTKTIAERACNFLKGFTIPLYRSAAKATSVKTETPIEISLANSPHRHIKSPSWPDQGLKKSN